MGNGFADYQKLQAFPRKHPLTRALQEYGRLIKTIHILRWYADETNRRRLNRQINKGEALHSLRSHLCYANQGEIREQQNEQLHNQVGCLNLVTNAVIVWNSVYIEKVAQQLKQEGQFPGDEELKHIWPTRHAHINVYGRYHFNQEQVGEKQERREPSRLGFSLDDQNFPLLKLSQPTASLPKQKALLEKLTDSSATTAEFVNLSKYSTNTTN